MYAVKLRAIKKDKHARLEGSEPDTVGFDVVHRRRSRAASNSRVLDALLWTCYAPSVAGCRVREQTKRQTQRVPCHACIIPACALRLAAGSTGHQMAVEQEVLGSRPRCRWRKR